MTEPNPRPTVQALDFPAEELGAVLGAAEFSLGLLEHQKQTLPSDFDAGRIRARIEDLDLDDSELGGALHSLHLDEALGLIFLAHIAVSWAAASGDATDRSLILFTMSGVNRLVQAVGGDLAERRVNAWLGELARLNGLNIGSADELSALVGLGPTPRSQA